MDSAPLQNFFQSTQSKVEPDNPGEVLSSGNKRNSKKGGSRSRKAPLTKNPMKKKKTSSLKKMRGKTEKKYEEAEKLRFVRAVGGALKHEIFNPLQSIMAANENLVMKHGRESSNKIITENVIQLRDVINTFSSLPKIEEIVYAPGCCNIINIHKIKRK